MLLIYSCINSLVGTRAFLGITENSWAGFYLKDQRSDDGRELHCVQRFHLQGEAVGDIFSYAHVVPRILSLEPCLQEFEEMIRYANEVVVFPGGSTPNEISTHWYYPVVPITAENTKVVRENFERLNDYFRGGYQANPIISKVGATGLIQEARVHLRMMLLVEPSSQFTDLYSMDLRNFTKETLPKAKYLDEADFIEKDHL